MSDHLLRQIFGITAVIKVCLQRIDEASAGAVPKEALQAESISKQLVGDVQETNRLKEKELFLQDLYSPQKSESHSGHSVKRVKLLTEQELSGELVTPGFHTDVRPLTCSLLTQTTKALQSDYPSGQTSRKGTLCDVETEPVTGYVEPIEDDLPSADENDIPNSQDSAARSQILTCVNPNANSRTVGRARKRTMCPCCIPGALDRQHGRQSRGGPTSTKARRKDGKTPGRINCVTAKNKQSCKAHKVPASDSFSATSTDSDELKRHEQIKRLKELLKEKEAALEMMRNNMISD